MEVLLKRLVEGMGTKVQYKSYLPGYYASRDLNEDGWPPYYEDAMASGQFYGTYSQRFVNGYTDYDKEALKQTMLNQEAMFRNQMGSGKFFPAKDEDCYTLMPFFFVKRRVHELHRLYRKQRELMEEFKLKEPCHYALQSQLSLPSSSSHKMFTMDRERIPSVPWPWDINCNLSSQSGSGGETPEPLKTLNNESGQASVMLTESGDSLKKSNLDSKLSKRPRVAIDLQLPADVYIDSENEKTDQGQGAFSFFGVAEYPSSNCNPQPGKDLKLGLRCNGNPSQGESWLGILRLQDAQRPQNFSDLNSPIPINGICHGASTTFLSNCLRGKAPLEETQGHQSSLPLQSSLLKMKDFQDLHKGAGSSLLDQQRSANQSERSSRFLSPLSDKTMLEPHQSGQFKVEESCDLPPFLMSKHMKMEAGCKEKLAGNNELFGTCIGTSYSALSSSTPSGPSALVPLSGRLGVPSPSRASQKKAMDGTPFAPIDVDTIPLFNESALLNHASISSKSIFSSGCVSNKFPLSKSLTSNQSFGSEASSYPNGFLHNLSHLSCQSTLPINFCSATHNYGGIPAQSSSIYGPKESFLRLDNKDAKPLKNLDLNLDLSTDCPDDFPSQQEMVSREPESKNSKTSGGLPWFRSSPSSKESIINLNITVRPDELSSQNFDRREQERNPSSDASRTPARSPKPTDCSSGKNVLAVDTVYPDGLTSEPSCRNNIIDLEKPAPMQPSLEDIQNDVSSPKVQINLNFMPTNRRRSSLQIDLEAPAISDVDDDALCCKETLELDQFLTPAETPKDGIVAKAETERQHDGATSAAEIIVAISSSMCRDNLDSIGVDPLDTSRTESLTWFADVVCSPSADDQGNVHGMSNAGVGKEDFDSEDVDLFEFMTLKLAETKPEDHWINHKPPKRDDTNNEEAGFASLLIGKPKRGQARKRRQKRDFQKDILPGLASLSRQEATEDLQTIGGLLRACGQSWEMGLARRNANRSGTWRSRGGRRARGGASATTRTRASSPSPTTLPNNTEVVINGTNMVGWGRTRRCRRARCPSGNVVLPLLPKE